MARTLEQILESEDKNIVANAEARAEAMLLDIHLLLLMD